MRRTPVVLGVLSMIFGGLVSLYSLFGLLSQSMVKGFTGGLTAAMQNLGPPRPGQPDPAAMMQAMTQLIDDLKPYTYAISGGFLIMSLALIAIGWGLYKRQSWSRPAALLWAACALVFLPFSIYINVGVVMPRTAEITNMYMGQMKMAGFMDSMMSMQKTITIVSHIIFYAPYPIILAILMGRSSARNDLLG
jgi:hypothetical protein